MYYTYGIEMILYTVCLYVVKYKDDRQNQRTLDRYIAEKTFWAIL